MLYAWVLSFFPSDSGLVSYPTSLHGRIFIFAAICMGFNAFPHRTMLYAWALRKNQYAHAICMGFTCVIEISMLYAWALCFLVAWL